MKLPSLQVFVFALVSRVVRSQECESTWKCQFTGTPPVLDADHGEWTSVNPYVTTLVNTVGEEYEGGQATFKCSYDWDNIYLMMEIPGEYRFSTEDNKLCAAIGTMTKVGPKASFLNMGGCPDAMGGCEDGVPEACVDYTVDIGAHWELKTTEQNTLYSMGGKGAVGAKSGHTASNETKAEPAGNDLVANNDDEYAVSPFCRFDDDDAKAGNEWSGAWAYTTSVEGEMGVYHFELSRTLKTASTVSDAQLAPGESVEFGIAYWDPFQQEELGWTDIGHFLTGCGTRWVTLELAEAVAEEAEPLPGTTPKEEDISDEPAAGESAASVTGFLSSLIAPVLVARLPIFKYYM